MFLLLPQDLINMEHIMLLRLVRIVYNIDIIKSLFALLLHKKNGSRINLLPFCLYGMF